MFAGIVEHKARILNLSTVDQSCKIEIENPFVDKQLKIGSSIAVSGVCLTLIESTKDKLVFDLSEETLRRTTLGKLKQGSFVNLERALKVESHIDGHLVTGHVDACVELLAREDQLNSQRYTWQLPEKLSRFVAEKGCVALDGVSLTVGEVLKNSFCVYVIPHTALVTTLDQYKVGEYVNLEVDLIARYVARSLDGIVPTLV